jgi:hypothetical protein
MGRLPQIETVHQRPSAEGISGCAPAVFARPGHSLGGQDREVFTRATAFDLAHPEDAQFIENVMWEDAKVMFVTVNLPGGSNNDLSPWTAPFNTAADKAAQSLERQQRTAADIRWLQAAFDTARANNDKALVVLTQADMWDPAALPAARASTNTLPLSRRWPRRRCSLAARSC